MLNTPLRKLVLTVLPLLLAGLSNTLHAQDRDPIHWVSPTIGSGAGAIGYGGTMPFVTPPFGMTNWTPQTRQNRLSVVSYNYADTTISGFMGTHQPAIWMGDYGYVTMMPEVGGVNSHRSRARCRSRMQPSIPRPIVTRPFSMPAPAAPSAQR